MKPIIEVNGVCKSFIIPHEKMSTLKSVFVNFWKRKGYERLDALKDITFHVKEGEFVGIIGSNGSGKSTLLKILAGIYKPDKGGVVVGGKVSPFLELGVGFNGELTAKENIYLYAAVLGLTKRGIDAKFQEILDFSELHRFVNQKLKNFSSGMQVRLAFSVAIQANAPILLIDEVLAVGDAHFQQKCFGVFERFKKEGRTIVFVSHDHGAVERFCDRVMLMENGKITMIGNAKEVVKRHLEGR